MTLRNKSFIYLLDSLRHHVVKAVVGLKKLMEETKLINYDTN